MKITLTFFEDPGHGWLRVPLYLVAWLKVGGEISSYSYKDEEFAYLEEDCDFGVFYKACKEKGIELATETNLDGGFIRNKKSYS